MCPIKTQNDLYFATLVSSASLFILLKKFKACCFQKQKDLKINNRNYVILL